MKLSIVILNYRTAKLTRQCLKTLLASPPALPHEIIVVDNDSRDGLPQLLAAQFPEVRLVEMIANLGYAAGNNAGIRAARGEYVLVLNPDIVVRPGAIEELVRYLDENADVGIVGPRLTRPDGSTDESCYRFPTWLVPIYRRTPFGRTVAGRATLDRYLMADFDRRETRDVDWLLGAVLLFRRELAVGLKLFDERYFLYFEDTDFCRSAWQAGWRVTYHPAAEMVHFHERHSARGPWFLGLFRRATRTHVVSCLKYFRKWGQDDVARRP